MNIVYPAFNDAAPVAVTQTCEGLAAIRQAHCPAVIWQRQPPIGLEDWLDALAPDLLPTARVILRPADAGEIVERICAQSGMPEGRRRLVDDVAALTNAFAELTEAPYLRLRLQAVATNSCRKFHVDSVTARLVCTYRGTGMQYGVAPGSGDPLWIFTVPTGAPIVLRGNHWPTDPPSALKHRSPPIEGTGETRLILVLDPIFDPDEEA